LLFAAGVCSGIMIIERAKSEFKRIHATGFMHVLGSQGAVRLIAGLQGLVLARLLGAEDLGRYAVFASALAMGTVIAQGGVPSALSRFVALQRDRPNQKALRDQACAPAVVWSFAVGAFLTHPWSGALISSEQWVRAALPLALLILPLQTITQSNLALLHGQALFPKKSAFEASNASLTLLVVVGGAALLGVNGAAGGRVIAAVIIALVIARSTRLKIPRGFSFPDGFSSFAVLSLFSASFSTMIHTIDTLVLGALRVQPASIGAYRVGSMVYALLSMAPAAAMHTAFPRLVSMTDRSEKFASLYVGIVKRLIPYGMVAAVFGLAVMPLVIAPLFGDEYREAEVFVRIFSAGLPMRALVLCAGSTILAIGRPGINLLLLVFSGGLNVFLNIKLIQAFGTVGAAWATLATETMSAIGGTWFAIGLIRRMKTR
jgi:O-antigen/teichoic acid export membrane protein